MRVVVVPIVIAALVLAASELASRVGHKNMQRWVLKDKNDGQIALRPICADYWAPTLDEAVDGGLVPVFLFKVDGATMNAQQKLRRRLVGNGFAVPDGTVTINGTKIVFAVGEGVLKTQRMADQLYRAMCRLEQNHIRLVHVRFNDISEANRMI